VCEALLQRFHRIKKGHQDVNKDEALTDDANYTGEQLGMSETNGSQLHPPLLGPQITYEVL